MAIAQEVFDQALIEALDRMHSVEDRLDMLERHLAGLCRDDCRCKLPG
jgi:hypothetical protein